MMVTYKWLIAGQREPASNVMASNTDFSNVSPNIVSTIIFINDFIYITDGNYRLYYWEESCYDAAVSVVLLSIKRILLVAYF